MSIFGITMLVWSIPFIFHYILAFTLRNKIGTNRENKYDKILYLSKFFICLNSVIFIIYLIVLYTFLNKSGGELVMKSVLISVIFSWTITSSFSEFKKVILNWKKWKGKSKKLLLTTISYSTLTILSIGSLGVIGKIEYDISKLREKTHEVSELNSNLNNEFFLNSLIIVDQIDELVDIYKDDSSRHLNKEKEISLMMKKLVKKVDNEIDFISSAIKLVNKTTKWDVTNIKDYLERLEKWLLIKSVSVMAKSSLVISLSNELNSILYSEEKVQQDKWSAKGTADILSKIASDLRNIIYTYK